MKSSEGVFRGVNLGDSQSDVEKKEISKPVESEGGYLYYEYKTDSLLSYSVTYNFDEKGLHEIHADLFISDSSKVATVFNNFRSYFNQYYGESESEMGYEIWTVKSDKYEEIKLCLTNESSYFYNNAVPGKISLWIYPNIQ